MSLAWGLVSGWSLTRDYAHSRHMIAALGAVVLLSAIIRLRLERGHIAYGAALYTTRFFVQYIVMFCLPLLYLASAWATLSLAAILGGATFSARAWRRIADEEGLTALARAFAFVLATSFAFVVLFPTRLQAFYPTLGAVAVLAALPWGSIARRVRPTWRSVTPFIVVLALVGVQSVMNVWIRVPSLSLWLRRPAIGRDVVGRELVERLSPAAPAARLAEALRDGHQICCLTPIVAPRGVTASVVHEWRADGAVIDRIELPPAAGTDDPDRFAYRTYSCKQNLPAVAERLECRVFVGGSLYVGRAKLDISP